MTAVHNNNNNSKARNQQAQLRRADMQICEDVRTCSRRHLSIVLVHIHVARTADETMDDKPFLPLCVLLHAQESSHRVRKPLESAKFTARILQVGVLIGRQHMPTCTAGDASLCFFCSLYRVLSHQSSMLLLLLPFCCVMIHNDSQSLSPCCRPIHGSSQIQTTADGVLRMQSVNSRRLLPRDQLPFLSFSSSFPSHHFFSSNTALYLPLEYRLQNATNGRN